MKDENYELSDNEHEEYQNDLNFIKEQLDLFGKEIEIPSSIYSKELIHLLENEVQDEPTQDDSTKKTNVIKLKQNIWKRPLTYAAMFALVFGVYYMSGIDNSPEITNAPEPAPMLANEGVAPRMVNAVDDVYAADYKEIRLALGAVYEEQEKEMRKDQNESAYSSSAAAPAAPPTNDGGGGGGEKGGGGLGGASDSQVNEDSSASAEDVSSTNAQVDGIDEADIVKTDGKNIYVYSSDMETQTAQVAIVEAETMTKVSHIILEEDKSLYGYGNMEMYLVEDRLVLLSSAAQRVIPIAKEILLKPISEMTGRLFESYNRLSASGNAPSGAMAPRADMYYEKYREGPNFSQVASAVIYDVSDNTNPKEVRRFEQDGNYVSSRVYDGILYLITAKSSATDARNDGASLADLVPVIGDSISGTSEPMPATAIAMMPVVYSPTYAVVSAVDIKSDTTPATTKAVLGAASQVYMSTDNIYITGDSSYSIYSSRRMPQTDIIKMSINGLNIEYKAAASVEGHIDNQFSLDEHKGNFRIATTAYRNSTTENNLYILDENLKPLGELEGLAPGERIYSVRYMGDMGYVVTFKQVDPLFAIDLSDPKNPKVLGQLKIPGFSEYMHPIDEHTLIGFGVNTEVDKNGNVRQSGIKLSMFDVSDPMSPKESNVFYIGNQGTHSELLDNHKAFMYNQKRSLIGFPITIQTEIVDPNIKDEWSRQYKTSFSGFMLMDVDKDTGFKVVANIPSNDDGTLPSWYLDEDAIRRGVYIDDKLYTVSFDKVMEYSLETNKKLREVKL